MTEEITKKIDAVLEGWFGETLEDSENEAQHRRHLYEPLRKVTVEAYQAGLQYSEGRQRVQLKLAQRRAAAANKNAARIFKEAGELRMKLFALRTKVQGIAPHLRAILNIDI